MKKGAPAASETRPSEPSLGRTVLTDLKQTDLPGSFRRDLREIYRFYLTDERRAELSRMGTVRGIFWFWGWLIKSLLMKLTPARRLALVAAALLLSMGEIRARLGEVQLVVHMTLVGVVLIVIVLMLELKDKLLARDEIEVARQVQLALLPRVHPDLEGWSIWSHTQPANDVGGDLVDYLHVDERRLGVALGDVAGKGLGAALLMSKLQATLRALAPTTASLSELGDRINTILVRDGLENRFATLFYVEIEPGRGTVRFLNAGHNPPFLVTRDAVQPLRADSPPLGMLPESRYAEQTRDLAPGEMLVIYSDGVTEALDDREEEFGESRLRAVAESLRGLDAEAAGRRLLESVRAYMGDMRPLDDLSLVLMVRR
ncbi:MAG: PP2C family protein-serine/threonine phosphatase [Candidatus Polarisedimenticolia bacterium]